MTLGVDSNHGTALHVSLACHDGFTWDASFPPSCLFLTHVISQSLPLPSASSNSGHLWANLKPAKAGLLELQRAISASELGQHSDMWCSEGSRVAGRQAPSRNLFPEGRGNSVSVSEWENWVTRNWRHLFSKSFHLVGELRRINLFNLPGWVNNPNLIFPALAGATINYRWFIWRIWDDI